MVVGEDSEHVDLCVGGEAEALRAASDDTGDEGAVAEAVVQRLLVRPVRALAHPLEVGVRLRQS